MARSESLALWEAQFERDLAKITTIKEWVIFWPLVPRVNTHGYQKGPRDIATAKLKELTLVAIESASSINDFRAIYRMIPFWHTSKSYTLLRWAQFCKTYAECAEVLKIAEKHSKGSDSEADDAWRHCEMYLDRHICSLNSISELIALLKIPSTFQIDISVIKKICSLSTDAKEFREIDRIMKQKDRSWDGSYWSKILFKKIHELTPS